MARYSKKMKLLINTPSLKFWEVVLLIIISDYVHFGPKMLNTMLSVGVEEKAEAVSIGCLGDIFKFIFRLLTFRPNIILLNPSLGDKALKRDFYIFKYFVDFFRKKTSVFIHGFNFEYAKNADWKWISTNLNKALCIFVLSQEFKNELIRRGVKSDIHLTQQSTRLFISGFDLR